MLQSGRALYGGMFRRRIACLSMKALGGLRMHKTLDGHFLNRFSFICHFYFCVIIFMIKKKYTSKSVQNFKWLGLLAFCYFYICFKERHMDFFVQ